MKLSEEDKNFIRSLMPLMEQGVVGGSDTPDTVDGVQAMALCSAAASLKRLADAQTFIADAMRAGKI